MTSLSFSDRGLVAPAPGGLAERVLRFAETSHARACALLLAIALACFLPGFISLQPMDRDEPRFAQASKQMLETRDFVDIRFQDEARHKKPVGIYWLQSATVAAAETLGLEGARTTIAVYRVPSLLGALATVLLTYWAGLAFLRRREAFLAAGLMGVSIILLVEAHLAKTDAVLTACSVALMGALARAWVTRGAAPLPREALALFWGGAALGILVKGPMVILFAGLAALVLSIKARSAHWLLALRPRLGLPLLLLAVSPWFLAIALKSGGAFFAASAGQDLLGKVGNAQTQHWAPPGTYLLVFYATFWPAAALAAMAIPFAWRERADDAVAFCLAWAVPSWLVFEAVPTKLPHYVMPLYPAIAILTVLAIARGFTGPHRPFARATAALIPLIPLALLVLLPAGAVMLASPVPWAALPVVAAACFVALLAWRLFARGEVGAAALACVPASVLLSVGVLGLAQPAFTAIQLSPRLAALARAAECPNPALATLGYREPSLVFLTRTNLDMLETPAEAVAFLQGGGCRLVFVTNRFEGAFRSAAATAGVQPALQGRVEGFNINGGRRLDIGAYGVAP